MGEDLKLAITVLADYGEDGKANLTYRILDSEGEEQRDGHLRSSRAKRTRSSPISSFSVVGRVGFYRRGGAEGLA